MLVYVAIGYLSAFLYRYVKNKLPEGSKSFFLTPAVRTF